MNNKRDDGDLNISNYSTDEIDDDSSFDTDLTDLTDDEIHSNDEYSGTEYEPGDDRKID